jgi:hypothetical protein
VSGLAPRPSPLAPPQLKVADFGIGGISASHELALDQRVTSSGTRMATVARGAYTPIYASPQQKKGNPPDPRDDVFALGVLGYQMLAADVTAERPGGKGWRRELQAQGAKPDLLDILEACWDDSAAERPADAGELLARLERVAAKEPPPVPAPPPMPLPLGDELDEAEPVAPRAKTRAAAPRPPARPVVKSSWTMMVLGTLALVLLVGVALMFATMGGGGGIATTKAGGGFTVSPSQILGDWNPADGGGRDISTVWRFGLEKVTVTTGGKTQQEGSYTLREKTLDVQWSLDGPMTYSLSMTDERTMTLQSFGKLQTTITLRRALK